jgi:hypothetical protein
MAGDSRCKWSDTELTNAVAASTSWRGLMRTLGLPETSPLTIMRAKQDIVRLNLNTSHFSKQRAWSDDQFKTATADAQSRSELVTALGLQPDSNNGWTRVKANAVRLGLDLSRLESTYDPDLIDLFFAVDGDMSMYLIPSQIIAGRVAVLLRTYSQYIVGNAAGLMASRPNALPGALVGAQPPSASRPDDQTHPTHPTGQPEPDALGCGAEGTWC